MKNEISIDYRYKEGWNVFTSKDVPGLCIANPNFIKCFNSIGHAVETLIWLNEKNIVLVSVQESKRSLIWSIIKKTISDIFTRKYSGINGTLSVKILNATQNLRD